MDSQVVVKALADVDPNFVALCDTLFGKAVAPETLWSALYGPDGVDVAASLVGEAPVGKMSPAPPDVMVPGTARKGVLKPLSSRPAAKPEQPRRVAKQDEDTLDITWSGLIAKADDEKRQVFGYASVVSVNGEPVVDKQGDVIEPEDIEKAAYEYVRKSRIGGHQHRRVRKSSDDAPFHASDLIESVVFTPEKIAKMGLPESTPVGWWVGYQVHDEQTWDLIKRGEVTGFSIHGRGKRVPVAA